MMGVVPENQTWVNAQKPDQKMTSVDVKTSCDNINELKVSKFLMLSALIISMKSFLTNLTQTERISVAYYKGLYSLFLDDPFTL